jgi:hypothetical protein
MTSVRPIIGLVVILVVAGIMVSFTVSYNRGLSTAGVPKQEVSTVIRDSLSDFLASHSLQVPSDAEHFPIQPGAKMLQVEANTVRSNSVGYVVAVPIQNVEQFYTERMVEHGWVVARRNPESPVIDYTWTQPSGTSPWHIHAYLALSVMPGKPETGVSLRWSRYPDADKHFPIYSGARDLQREYQEETDEWGTVFRVTTKTYVVDAAPKQVANYYNKNLPQYGWFFVDPGSYDEPTAQVGNISSKDGILFAAAVPQFQNKDGSGTSLSLSISAEQLDSETLRVTIRTVAHEPPGF